MLSVTLLATSCSKDENLMEDSEGLALAQTEMTYEQILKGYTLEEMAAPKDETTPTTTPETKADAELMKLLQEASDNSYSKTSTRSGTVNGLLPYMGVFKVTTCGNYPELKIFMDCEDGGWTKFEGYQPEKQLPYTTIDKNHNITMTFCLVLQDQNVMVPKDMGALYFVGGNASLIQNNAEKLITKPGSTYPNLPRLAFVERWHDNEDHSNKNSATLNGGALTGGGNELGDRYANYTPRPTAVGNDVKNFLLTWVFSNYDPIKTFHPGFSYGVLTRWKDYNLKICIDDENGKNKNDVSKVEWSGTSNKYIRKKQSDPYEDNYLGISVTENTSYNVKIII